MAEQPPLFHIAIPVTDCKCVGCESIRELHDAARHELDDEADDSPFCECQLEAMEDEDASNCCSACGKPLR